MHQMRQITHSTLEYRAASFTILWGVWLLCGNETSLDAMAFTVLRETWQSAFPGPVNISVGLTAVLTGVLYIVAIAINGKGATWTPITRLLCSGFNVAFFATVSFSIARVDFWSPGTLTYAAIACGFFTLFTYNTKRVEQSFSLIKGRIKWKTY